MYVCLNYSTEPTYLAGTVPQTPLEKSKNQQGEMDTELGK